MDNSSCPSPVFASTETPTLVNLAATVAPAQQPIAAPAQIPAPGPQGCGSEVVSNHYGLMNLPMHLLNSPLDGGEVRLQSQTQDSSLHVVGALNSSEHSLILRITNLSTGEVTNQYLPASSCGVDTNIYLHGAGKYSVEVWANTSTNMADVSHSNYEGKFETENLDNRSVDLLPSGKVQSNSPEIIALSQKIIGDAHAVTDLDKAHAIHDWLIKNIQYNYLGVHIDDNGVITSSTSRNYDALESLHDGNAICEGYSNLYAALNRAAGIPTRVVYGNIIYPKKGETWEKDGTKNTHAWNQVLVDGNWITVDATWDVWNSSIKQAPAEFVPPANLVGRTDEMALLYLAEAKREWEQTRQAELHQQQQTEQANFNPSNDFFSQTHRNPVVQLQ